MVEIYAISGAVFSAIFGAIFFLLNWPPEFHKFRDKFLWSALHPSLRSIWRIRKLCLARLRLRWIGGDGNEGGGAEEGGNGIATARGGAIPGHADSSRDETSLAKV